MAAPSSLTAETSRIYTAIEERCISDDEFAYLLSLGHERRDVEFKPPGRRGDNFLFAQVTRAALGMANTRGGGFVIIGVEERAAGIVATGLSAEERDSWRYDDVAARLAAYADPWIDFGSVKEQPIRLFRPLPCQHTNL